VLIIDEYGFEKFARQGVSEALNLWYKVSGSDFHKIGEFSMCMNPDIVIGILFSLAFPWQLVGQTSDELPAIPELAREYRGVWVATVANIDWPSKPGLSTDVQQAEAIRILDRVAELRMNVVVLQVRTSCDALYASELEPWSYFLTGRQGSPPEPYYDPLTFWIEQAHRRGLELHAWFNPFRAKNSGQKYEDAPQHISQTHPSLVKRYGNDTTNYLWLDPGEEAARKHSLAVFLDVVRRYDIDGIHIDDYFYPYPVDEQPFPDDPAWDRYVGAGGLLSREDWRRDSMNEFIKRLYAEIKQTKPHVRFGISPFGIWKPGHPTSVAGFSQYDKLYADAKLWLNEGWCDYYSPQLYWSITAKQQSFPALLSWWAGENKCSRHLAPGIYTGRIGNPNRAFTPEQIESQVFVARHLPGSCGTVHFSMKTLLQNREGIGDKLKENAYGTTAVTPACTWLDEKPPKPPKLQLRSSEKQLTVTWEPGDQEPVRRWCTFQLRDGVWGLTVLDGKEKSWTTEGDDRASLRGFGVSALDAAGNESKRATIQVAH
jgi:uncharacterized lipoprotein YddW (UPF0748 family)